MTALANKIKCGRCGREVIVDNLENLRILTADIAGITRLEGIIVAFEYCENCREDNEQNDFPEIEISQVTEHLAC